MSAANHDTSDLQPASEVSSAPIAQADGQSESGGARSSHCRSEARGNDWLWIAIVLAVVIGRIVALQPLQENRYSPFLSANDRSRWATIRALGDDGLYSIDHLTADRRSVYNTIDKVRHIGRDGQLHEYSSKPTLLPTIYAYLYRAIRAATSWSLDHQPFAVARLMLVLVNAIPLGLLLLAVADLARRRGASNWTRAVLIVGLGLGTFLGTFSVSLNNHVIAAVSIGISLWCWLACWPSLSAKQPASASQGSGWWFALGGASGAFGAANELPALSFFCLAALGFLWLDWKKALSLFAPAAAIVACASFATNYQAHGSWRPAYAHRSDGAVIAQVPAELAEGLVREEFPPELRRALEGAGERAPTLWSLKPGLTEVPEGVNRWVLTDLTNAYRWALVQPEADAPIEIRTWDNWYEYEGSYWSQPRENRSAVDQGEPSRALYAWHMLLGHHGLFSLTPLFLLSIAGIGLAFRSSETQAWKGFAAATLLLSVVCFGFYLSRPLIDRNYGGQTSVLRWMLWLAPLWILLAIDPVQHLKQKAWGKSLVILLLVLSIVSAAYSHANPWVHPWLYTLLNPQ